MAHIRMDHNPVTIGMNLPVDIIVPDPGKMDGIPVAERKVLYLLHGLTGDASTWQRYSSIENYASTHGLVVVMPSAGRSFYTDLPSGQKYFSYLTEELPLYLEDVFNLKPERENTFIAGNSMGGYGAVKAALLRPDLYSAAASFSGILSLEFVNHFPDDPRIHEFSLIFGDMKKLAGSQYDPAVWLQAAASLADRDGQDAVPKLFISCGRQEDVYPLSGMFFTACNSLGLQAIYHEEDAEHDWYFWDRQIRWFLEEVLGEGHQHHSEPGSET